MSEVNPEMDVVESGPMQPLDAVPGKGTAAKSGGTSLRARMEARRDELANRKTEIFAIPRYEKFIGVELKAVPWEKTQSILEKNQHRAMTNTAAEEIVSATVNFYEITEDGQLELIEDVRRWIDIGVKFLGIDPPDAPPLTQDRIAMIALCSDQGIMSLSGEFRQWLGGANVGLSRELASNFQPTP
jgi:hypothetical protein